MRAPDQLGSEEGQAGELGLDDLADLGSHVLEPGTGRQPQLHTGPRTVDRSPVRAIVCT
jgi:hypothetical protein